MELLDEQILYNIGAFLEILDWKSSIEYYIAMDLRVPVEPVKKLNADYANTLKIINELNADYQDLLKRSENYQKVYDSVDLICSICYEGVSHQNREECPGCEKVYCSNAYWNYSYRNGHRDCGTTCDGCDEKLCYDCLEFCGCCGCRRLFCKGCYIVYRQNTRRCCGPECDCNHL
jgi:hypothetical protein